MAGCLHITVDLGSSANEFAADRFVRSGELSLLSTSIPSELFDTALENCSAQTSQMLGASPCPPDPRTLRPNLSFSGEWVIGGCGLGINSTPFGSKSPIFLGGGPQNEVTG